jgi:hypothetical protein
MEWRQWVLARDRLAGKLLAVAALADVHAARLDAFDTNEEQAAERV